MSEEEKKGFILKDIDDAQAKGQGVKKPATEKNKGSDSRSSYPLPQINFSTFILSLNSSALVLLGAVDDPATGGKARNLPLAKQTIDIIGMLEEKTRGNLSNDEDKLLKNILHDLRIMYVREKG